MKARYAFPSFSLSMGLVRIIREEGKNRVDPHFVGDQYPFKVKLYDIVEA